MNRFIPLSLLFLLSCSNDQPPLSKEDLFNQAKAYDERVKLIMPSGIADTIPCSNYGEGCLSVHRADIGGVEMIAVEFKTWKHAQKGAEKIRGYYKQNWVFDDVYGEPYLIKFVKNAFDAKATYEKEKDEQEKPVGSE